MPETSALLNARYVAKILKAHHCRHVVIAPGSRNAPLILAFTADADYECISVPDERVAAFTAMGMTIGLKAPVAVICSSGSAAVNFYPAVTEAFYQRLPLLLITADRPKEFIDQGMGQTIRQENIFEQHICFSANLLRDPADELSRHYNQRLLNQAMMELHQGPVHVNVPFNEPLYETVADMPEQEEVHLIQKLKPELLLDEDYLTGLGELWNNAPKIMILAGQMDSNPWLEEAIQELNERSPFLVLSETVSNLSLPNAISTIDRLINTISEEEKAGLAPDLLITIGGEIVSKMVKKFLKDHVPKHHWHVDEAGELRDSFQCLQTVIPVQADNFFEQLFEFTDKRESSYSDHWLGINREKQNTHTAFIESAVFSDLTAFGQILEQMPEDGILHCANSAAIRYAQLFDHPTGREHYANRGTSGIDGCTATAIGHALTTNKQLTLITGDVAFLYDSNAFWNNRLPDNIKIIILNNQGGNIFRIIPGPEGQKSLETYQETVHNLNARGVADTFKIEYQSAHGKEELRKILPGFFNKRERAILEIFTPRLESPEVLKDYFKAIKGA